VRQIDVTTIIIVTIKHGKNTTHSESSFVTMSDAQSSVFYVKHSSVTVSDIYAPLTYDMCDSVRQLIRYIKESLIYQFNTSS